MKQRVSRGRAQNAREHANVGPTLLEHGGSGSSHVNGARQRQTPPPDVAIDNAGGQLLPYIGRRVWLLLLLDCAERAGVGPVNNMRVHRLAFLANCLAAVYDLPAPDGKILKYRRGPFYPVLQWDLDRLVAQDLVTVAAFEHIADEFGAWFRADYCLSDAGVDAIADILIAPAAARMHAFLLEILAAYSTLPDESRTKAALEDATYSDPIVRDGSVIDFAEWEQRNYTKQATESLAKYVPGGVRVSRREKLHLYFRYLDRMVMRAAG